MAETLLITKKSTKTWVHLPSDLPQFIIGKFTFSIDGDDFQIVELGQAKRNKYNFTNITVYDETTDTTYDSFASVVELSTTLEDLGYPAFLRDGEVTGVASVNGLTGIVVVSGANINVIDPTTATDAPLNEALQNIFDSGGGGYTVVSSNQTASNDTNYTVVANATFTDPSPTEGKGYVVYVRNGTATIGGTGYAVGSLVFRVFHSGGWSSIEYKSNISLQAVTDVGNTITDGTDTNTVSASGVSVTDFTDSATLTKSFLEIIEGSTGNVVQITSGGVVVSDGTNGSYFGLDRIQVNSVGYPLPTGASSQIATLADITGGVTDEYELSGYFFGLYLDEPPSITILRNTTPLANEDITATYIDVGRFTLNITGLVDSTKLGFLSNNFKTAANEYLCCLLVNPDTYAPDGLLIEVTKISDSTTTNDGMPYVYFKLTIKTSI